MAADHETIFTMEATPVKFGSGASADAGWELKRLGVRRAMLVTDPRVAALGYPERIKDAIEGEGIEVVVYDRARVEPTIDSFQDAADFARRARGRRLRVGWRGLEHGRREGRKPDLHPPRAGDGLRQPAGRRGQEAAVAAEAAPRYPDDVGNRLGGDHGGRARHPRPQGQDRDLPPLPACRTQALVDPELTRSLPAEVTSSTGLDVVCHAAESYLSKPFDTRERPDSPDDRPPYQGSNPIADVWSAKALEFGGRYLRRAVADRDDVEARGFMMLAATMAGVGFGSAGVHIPHSCAYPIASVKHEYQPPGYPDDHPFVPHGHSVIVTAPAAFRFTYDAMPERHHQVAELLANEPIADPGPDTLPDILLSLMKDIDAPRGVAELGYTEDDIPALVDGALKQQRLLAVAPKEVGEDDLRHVITASMSNW